MPSKSSLLDRSIVLWVCSDMVWQVKLEEDLLYCCFRQVAALLKYHAM